jgi:hypothetical protein
MFHQAREYLLSIDGIVEQQKPRITTYSNANGGICHLRTMPHGIDIGFLKGARMSDPDNRLTGKGKILRVLSLRRFDREVIAGFVDQALLLNG